MSRGPGRIERAIEASWRGNPNQAPSTEELCGIAYPGLNRVEKKHRIATIRAAERVRIRHPGWFACLSEGLGRQMIWCNRYSLRSYALMKVKTSSRYRSNDPRVLPHWTISEAEAIAKIEPGGDRYHCVVEGGDWWLHVQFAIVERDSDQSAHGQRIRSLYEAQQRTLRDMFRPRV